MLINDIAASLAFLTVILVLRWFGVIPRVEPWRPRWYQRMRLWIRLRRLNRSDDRPAWPRRQTRPRWAVWTLVFFISLVFLRLLQISRQPQLDEGPIAQKNQPQPVTQTSHQGDRYSQVLTDEQQAKDVDAPIGNGISIVLDGVWDTRGNHTATGHIFDTTPNHSRVGVSLELVCNRSQPDCASLRHQYRLGYPEYVAFYLLREGDPRGYPDMRSVISVWDVTGNDGFNAHQIYAVIDRNAVLARWISEHPPGDDDAH